MPLLLPYPYIICLHLTQPPQTYGPLVAELERSFKWWHYVPSVWIVLHYDSLIELANRLRPLIRQPDRLLILPAKGPADGWLPADAWHWISENLPRQW